MTDFKIETREGQDRLRVALQEDEVLEGDQLPAHCELWVYEGMKFDKPERMYVDHQERVVTVVPPTRGDSLRPGRRPSVEDDTDRVMRRSMSLYTLSMVGFSDVPAFRTSLRTELLLLSPRSPMSCQSS